jgi:REP element-mobilizing transposase RayT
VAFDPTLAAILGNKAGALSCVLLAAGCGPDHVHVLLRLAPTVTLADVVQRLKGATAHDVNQGRLLAKHLAWQAGYWAESLGPADLEPLARYLRVQRQHHDESHPAERWHFDDAQPEPA